MLVFKAFQNGLYLPSDTLNDPAEARLGFLFRDSRRTDDQISLSGSWNENLGYYLFFPPDSSRDWGTFVGKVREAFGSGSNRQFGWFLTGGAPVAEQSFLAVNRSTSSQPVLQDSVSLFLRNVSLQLVANPVEPLTITLSGDVFAISNPLGNSITLTIDPRSGSSRQINANAALQLPMTGTLQGTVGSSFTLSPQDLEANETGNFYFTGEANGVSSASAGNGAAATLTALRYPVLRPAAKLTSQVQLDVLAATDPDRSYLQLPADKIPSYFADSIGRTVDLVPQAGTVGTTAGIGSFTAGRLVFAPRPVTDLDDDRFYYFALAGNFRVDAGQAEATVQRSRLLCGVSGTEYLDVALGTDELSFIPGQAAYQVTATNQAATQPSDFLSNQGGRAITSWLSLQTSSSDDKYVAQPQQAPLYDPKTSGSIGPSTEVYLLDFRDQAAWAPGGSTTSAPSVPMAPYAGTTANGVPVETYLAVESQSINPARRVIFANATAALQQSGLGAAVSSGATANQAMTPQGLLAGFDNGVWTTTDLAISKTSTLRFSQMGDAIRRVLSQNQIFSVISQVGDQFDFSGDEQILDIADWLFQLSPDLQAAPNGDPPVLILKFYEGESIASLIQNRSLWSEADTFNQDPAAIQKQVEQVIEDARQRVFGDGTVPDTNSIYYPFWQAVTSESFTGLLTLNANIVLTQLPGAIRAVLGGMTKTVDGQRVSNVDAFRAHHVGVEINDTDPTNANLDLAKSSLFGLVDYEKPSSDGTSTVLAGIETAYGFEVEFLRALFVNTELREFSCRIQLTVNQLFDVNVTLGDSTEEAGDDANVVAITGSYQAHSSSDDDASSGEGVYSFVAEGTFEFTFGDNPYLDKLTFSKVQFSASDETASESSAAGSDTSTIESRFSIWGNMKFKELNVLDVFSFDKLTFADLGISMSFDITTESGKAPTTTLPDLSFSPGNLRFDLNQSTSRETDSSLLSLLPFRLTSFLYSEKADTTLEQLGFFALDLDVPGFAEPGADTFRYALIFDFDLGTLGALVGSLEAFQFTILIGWQPPPNDGILLGLQLPQADGKLEITIEGVLTISIERFVLKYVENDAEPGSRLLVVALLKSFIEVFGKRLPPSGTLDFALFSPAQNADQIGWIAAFNNEPSKDASLLARPSALRRSLSLPEQTCNADSVQRPRQTGDEEDSKVFDLLYLGAGQRVGPDPSSPPTNFAEFLSFMTDDFYQAFAKGDYTSIYHADGQWLAVAHFKILDLIEFGFVFYDVTPFYSLTINVTDLFDFEITYTKVSDDVGLFYIDFGLPESLRQFNVGVIGVTLPKLAISIFTNGDWKLDVGFPKGDDWSRSFQLQAQAGPFPVLGSGGFYVAKLSSATSDLFTGNYDTIVAFGFAARLGLGKSVTYGPLSAGVSVTFFGIIEGAAAWNANAGSSGNVPVIFTEPQALALKGEFGIIGELYGSIDFKIITASVSVRLTGAIGIQLYSEVTTSIELYVRASVLVSAKARINLGFFKITISFQFKASIQLEWTLVDSASKSSRTLLAESLFAQPMPLFDPSFARLPGVAADVALLFLPELTMVFANTTSAGTVTMVCSLGAEFLTPSDSQPVPPQDFKSFESISAQLVTWAVGSALGLSGSDYTVTLDQLSTLDQNPELLIGGIDYDKLIQQFANSFVVTINGIGKPNAKSDDQPEVNATPVPMFPFLQLSTQGRLDDSGKPQDLSYAFDSTNTVDQTYLDETLPAYFAQTIVNQDSPSSGAVKSKSGSTPLAEAMFLQYYLGLIKGGVNQLVTYLHDEMLSEGKIDELISAAVGKSYFAQLAGSMSNVFRGGTRLPNDDFTTPLGGKVGDTLPVYSALWQQFSVGKLSPIQGVSGKADPATDPTSAYTLSLENPDTSQGWVKSNADYWLTNLEVDPYSGITVSDLALPSEPVPLPFLELGARSYSFQRSISWSALGTEPVTRSVRPFPPGLLSLSASVAGPVMLEVSSRQTGGAFLPDGTALDGSDFEYATLLTIGIQQVPTGSSGADGFAPNTYAIRGASQSDQVVLRNLLAALGGGSAPTIASIDVLYQSAAGASGLSSVSNPKQVFALRTNTTIDSLPPTATFLLANVVGQGDAVPVGADLSDPGAFLQILEQASVTNQTGYDLYYFGDANIDGGDLPQALFAGSDLATLNFVVRFAPETTNPRVVETWHNAVVLTAVEESLLYYATTTEAALQVYDVAVAAGAIGVLIERDNSGDRLTVPVHPSLAAAAARSGLSYEEAEGMLRDAGVQDSPARRRLLADSGGAIGSLDTLYSRISFQIQSSEANGTPAFVKGNLSVPASPQSDADAPATATDTYRIFPPLYKRAASNVELPAGSFLDRYASLGDPYAVDFWLLDSFGNQVPTAFQTTGTTAYFDNLISVSEWLGVLTAYDFRAWDAPSASGMNCQGARAGSAQPALRKLTVYLCPNANTLVPDTTEDLASVLAGRIELYETIADQLDGPGVSFYVETNLDADNTKVALSADQASALRGFVASILTYLKQLLVHPKAPLDVEPIGLTIEVPNVTTNLSEAFALSIELGIERDPNLIANELKKDGVIIYPRAQDVASGVPARLDGVDLSTFAAEFVTAFPALTLAVSLDNAPGSGADSGSARAQRLAALREANVPSDGSGSRRDLNYLWAVQTTLIDIEIGSSGDFQYLAPTPLDVRLNSGTVPLPQMAPLHLPATRVFTDVDLDRQARTVFQSIDSMLAPVPATGTYRLDPEAYEQVARGREAIARKYSFNEVQWLFAKQGSDDQLQAARDAFEQQMRQSLFSAYTIDTVIQTEVRWKGSIADSAQDRFLLFGQVQRATGGDANAAAASGTSGDPSGLSTARIDVVPGDGSQAGLFTFTFGTPRVRDVADLELDLVYSLTHVEYFLEPKDATPAGQARPSLWLQLVQPKPAATPPHIGPQGSKTMIPLILREYPTPPTTIAQSGGAVAAEVRGDSDPLTQAASWEFDTQYQAQLTAHDEVLADLTYNTNLQVSGSNGATVQLDADAGFSLFDALMRMTAALVQLQPLLSNLSGADAKQAVEAFGTLVSQLADNSDWQEPTAVLRSSLTTFTDQYTIIDEAQDASGNRLITLCPGTSTWPGATVAIEALDLSEKPPAPYPDQEPGTTPEGCVTDQYQAQVSDDFVAHQLMVKDLDVRVAENALSGVSVRRNARSLGGQVPVNAFIYSTPLVRFPQPTTPFLDNDAAIDIAKLPGSTGEGLNARIETLLNDLLEVGDSAARLRTVNAALADAELSRRIKIECRYRYSLPSAVGASVTEALSPVFPVLLARSFDLPVDGQSNAIQALATLLGGQIASWASDNRVVFGSDAEPAGAMLLFDITLYARLSETNTPVLRLKNLQLRLVDVDPDDPSQVSTTSQDKEAAMSNFKIINQNANEWDGSPTTLSPNQSVKMNQTPVGKIILAYKNVASDPNEGLLAITSGGSPPNIITVESLLNAPGILIENFDGNNLNITNISKSANIWVEASGPGIQKDCGNLPINETVSVKPYGCVTRRSNPNYMRLTLTAPGQYSVMTVYTGSDPSVYAINAPDPSKVPDGYTKVTASNQIALADNWLGKTIWVGNLSPDTADAVNVEIIDL